MLWYQPVKGGTARAADSASSTLYQALPSSSTVRSPALCCLRAIGQRSTTSSGEFFDQPLTDRIPFISTGWATCFNRQKKPPPLAGQRSVPINQP